MALHCQKLANRHSDLLDILFQQTKQNKQNKTKQNKKQNKTKKKKQKQKKFSSYSAVHRNVHRWRSVNLYLFASDQKRKAVEKTKTHQIFNSNLIRVRFNRSQQARKVMQRVADIFDCDDRDNLTMCRISIFNSKSTRKNKNKQKKKKKNKSQMDSEAKTR